ncbi:MAG: nucleotidyltransferase domain-containing protein [Bacteroidota bacterium]|nr:nucleotidyltransferase domain-containing protein [Bacteroidota bacterium]
MGIPTIIEQTTSIIRKYLPLGYRIVLFGSQAKGNALATSDIDIVVVGKEKVPPLIMAKIRNEVEEIRTLKGIDVVDLMTVDESYRKNVLSYAKEISV